MLVASYMIPTTKNTHVICNRTGSLQLIPCMAHYRLISIKAEGGKQAGDRPRVHGKGDLFGDPPPIPKAYQKSLCEGYLEWFVTILMSSGFQVTLSLHSAVVV